MIPGLVTVPRQRRAQESLLRVLTTAEALIARGGFEGVTMAGLAEAAEVSIGSIYRYFPDRAALLVAVQDRFLTRHEEHFRQVSEGARSLDGVIDAMVDGAAMQFLESPRVVLAFLTSRTDPRIEARGKACRRIMQETFIKACLPFRDEIPHPDPQAALVFAHHLMTGLTLLLAHEGDEGSVGWKARWRGMIGELKQSSLLYLKTPPSPQPSAAACTSAS